jgi:PAS domain S-box-containing protein
MTPLGRFLDRLTIRSLFRLAIGALALLAVVAMASLAFVEYERADKARHAAEALDLLDATLQTVLSVGLERGTVNILLLDGGPAGTGALAELALREADTDKMIGVAWDRLKRAGLSDAPELHGDLMQLHQSLDALRGTAAAQVARPLAQRDAGFRAVYISAMFDIGEALSGLNARIAAIIGGLAPEIAGNSTLARFAVEMRDYVGRRSNFMVAMVGASIPVTTKQIVAGAELTGRVRQMWKLVETQSIIHPFPPAVTKAIDAVRSTYFGELETLYGEIFQAGITTATYPIGPEDLRRKNIAAAVPIFDIARLSISDGQARAKKIRSAALRSFGVAVIALIATLTIAVGVFVGFDRRVGKAVLALTDVLLRLADGDHSVVVPSRDRDDEIGRIARAVETLKVRSNEATASLLHGNRVMLQAIINQVPARVSVKGRDLRYIFVNISQAREFGCTPDEAVGGVRQDFRRPGLALQSEWEFFDEVVDRDRLVLETGQPSMNVEEVLTFDDGRREYALSSKVPLLDADGAVIGIISVSVDITAQKQTEVELRDARTVAEAASMVKSEFLANMSHEIRTPMNGILGMNGLLLRSKLTPTQRRFADAVQVSADSLLVIINDILDISKLEAGKVELEEIDFSLETMVEDAVELLSPRVHQKSLEITSNLDEAARRRLRGDPTRLRQVLLNLLSNALKFTERGSIAVEVTARAVDPGRTAVRDRGAGYGHRPQRRGQGEAVPEISAGRRLHHPPVRRHRARPVDLPPTDRADGRRDRGDRSQRQRQHLLDRGHARERFGRITRCPRARGRRKRTRREFLWTTARSRGGRCGGDLGRGLRAGDGRPPHPAGRGQRDQYAARLDVARGCGLYGRSRDQRHGCRRGGPSGAVRSDPDGCPDVRHGRATGNATDPGGRRRSRCSADRGDDRQCHASRSGSLSRRRDGRFRVQADRRPELSRRRRPLHQGRSRRNRWASPGEPSPAISRCRALPKSWSRINPT